MVRNDYDLRPLWCELLAIYQEIATVANRHKLRYYAAGGTILGAIRHKGFIPWDDDLDLYMPRSDYVKLMEFAKKEFPKSLVWKSTENDSRHKFLYGKVCLADANEVRRLQSETSLSLSDGVFVDIFPLDGLPSTKFGMFLFCCMRSLLRHAAARRWWSVFFGMGKDAHKNRLRMQRWYSSWKYEECKMVGAVSPYDKAATLSRWWFKKSWFETAKIVPFENTEIPIPVGSHEIMTGVFGDYMTLPPAEKRVPSHQCL